MSFGRMTFRSAAVWTVAWIAGFSIVLAFAVQPTVHLQTSRACQPIGWVASMREAVNSSGFWMLQKDALAEEIKRLDQASLKWMRTQEKIDQMAHGAKEELEKHREKMYKKYPKGRPSAEEVLAGELRRQADRLAMDAVMKRLRSNELARADDYQNCLDQLEARQRN